MAICRACNFNQIKTHELYTACFYGRLINKFGNLHTHTHTYIYACDECACVRACVISRWTHTHLLGSIRIRPQSQCMYACMTVCVCMYECMHQCMYICMCVCCMYVKDVVCFCCLQFHVYIHLRFK